MKNISVGIADYNIVKFPDKITTVGLGSCCGVVIYDEINKVAGLVHVLLSDSSLDKKLVNKAKYADTAITFLVEELKKKGANPRLMKAKIAGGAHMFNFSKDVKQKNIFTIGEKNVNVCKEYLRKHRIPIVSEDVLGNYGRTIMFDTENNKLKVKSVGKIEKFI
ncbi:MAG: chemotaxis protein CheD [Peptostreptococcaceae bacterium]